MDRRVYEFLRSIPVGKVVTYGQIAVFLGNKGLARHVGNILHKNPDGELFPCYKVVNSKGCLSAQYAFGGVEAQKKRLQSEGIEIENDKVDLTKYQWQG